MQLWIAAAIAAAALGLSVFFMNYLGMPSELREEMAEGDWSEEPVTLRAPTEAMLAVDAFEDTIHSAASVPFSDQVRLDRDKVERLLERLRMAPGAPSTLSGLFYELDELVRNAKPIPLTDQIRLDRDEVYDIIDRMRASFAEER